MTAPAIATPPAVKERPILFSAPMVKAIRAGLKTQTRRVVTPQPEPIPLDQRCRADLGATHWWPSHLCKSMVTTRDMGGLSPHGARGDHLWVRETWRVPKWLNDRAPSAMPPDIRGVSYVADEPPSLNYGKTRVAIHMPRWASRILLAVESMRVERVQEISEVDAKAEGVDPWIIGHGPVSRALHASDGSGRGTYDYRNGFEHLWDSINGARPGCSWEANPWVWVIGFRVLEGLR
jgi:hypothetical protein